MILYQFRYLIFIGIVFLLSVQCSPLKRISKQDVQSFSVGSTIVVENSMISDDAKLEINFLGFFKQNNPAVKLCTLQIESATSLILSYFDSTSINTDKLVKHRFEGKLLKSGVFEIYYAKKRIEIPPLIPIIYSNVSIRRIRIGLLTDKRLAIEYKYVNTGNWFLMAAGSSSRDSYYFNLVDYIK